MALALEKQASNQREAAAKRSRDAFRAVSDIGEIPPIKDKERRDSCEFDLHKFLVTYFPNGTGLKPFGPKQIDAIKELEHSILQNGRTLSLLPRGYAKSSISEGACLWAAVYGHRRYILFLGANEESASIGIESIKRELMDNDLLAEDFPHVCWPIAALEGKAQRTHSQSCNGELTHIEWTGDKIVFAEVGSPSDGAVISAAGLLAASRGARHLRSDGTRARPDFVVIDDPQTDQSALSPAETAKRLRVIKHSVLRLGGHGKQVSVVMNATMIAAGDLVDQLSDRKKYPGWKTVRAATVLAMPKALESHWLKEYADILRNFDEDDIDGQKKALADASAYYRANWEVMNEGAVVAWEDVPLEPGEISALQHALNILILEGEEVFDAECQNNPSKKDVATFLQVTKKVCDRKNGHDRKESIENASFSVFHIDVHDEILYWSQASCRQDFTGAITAYGTWPPQPTSYFAHSKVKKKLINAYPGTTENAVRLGLVDLLRELGKGGVTCGLVDAGYKPDIVSDAIRMAGVSSVFSSKGIGIGPAEKPMAEYDLSAKRCFKKGPDPTRPRWYFPREHVGRLHFDANFWKDFAASRLTQEIGHGAWTLYGSERVDHGFYADHLCSEQPVAMAAKGRTCNVWKVIANRDNHYWDTFVGCVVAASVSGSMLPGQVSQKPVVKRRPRNRVQDLNW